MLFVFSVHCTCCFGVINTHTHTHTHTRLMALCPGLPRWASTKKEKPIWILLKQETVSGDGISWAICKSAPCSRQITTPAPHHSVFLQAGCPSCRPTNSVKALKAIINTNSKLNGSWVTTCSRPVIDLSCTPGGNWSLKQHCRCLESMVLGAPGSRRGHAGSLITQCNRSQSARLCRAAASAGYQFCHHHSTSTVPPRPLSTGGTIYKISYDLS